MKRLNKQSGFATWELLLVLVVIAAVAYVGLQVYGKKSTPVNSTTASSTTPPVGSLAVPSAPTVNSASDLDKASTTLDQVDPDASNTSDSAQLTTQSASF